MTCDLPCMSYMALYVISMHIVNSNSRSHHWKLNLSTGKVEPAKTEPDASSPNTKSDTGKYNSAQNSTESSDEEMEILLEDKMMDILTTKSGLHGEWVVSSSDSSEGQFVNINNVKGHNCDKDAQYSNACKEITENFNKKTSSKVNILEEQAEWKKSPSKSKPLTCGKRVNSTQYDHLRGISERHLHTHIPEPDVAMVFQTHGKSSEVDMNDLEQKLRIAKRDMEKDSSMHKHQHAQIYNLIGNFWRIKGNTQSSIECFRKALSISPEDPDILLNLARVLFNLRYLDDAIFLARRSLHLQPQSQNTWLQHYTLGEILKTYGHPQEAAMHFNQALLLNPGFQPAKSHLRELDTDSRLSVTHLTLFIILFLVVGVLFGIVTSIESNFQDTSTCDSSKVQQRHFNRAMAMRSIKLGINPRMCRLRKVNS